MSGCDADVASLVRQAIYDVNQSTIEDEDIFDYLVSVISDDTFEFGENAEDAHDTLGPLLVRFFSSILMDKRTALYQTYTTYNAD